MPSEGKATQMSSSLLAEKSYPLLEGCCSCSRGCRPRSHPTRAPSSPLKLHCLARTPPLLLARRAPHGGPSHVRGRGAQAFGRRSSYHPWRKSSDVGHPQSQAQRSSSPGWSTNKVSAQNQERGSSEEKNDIVYSYR
jgi:hypothetical protein